MPKRSDRDVYGEAFDQNPFEDMEPLDMYTSLQWDKEPEAVWDIEAPEPLVAIGELARLDFAGDSLHEAWDEELAPFLAVGRDSNVLYVLPKDVHGAPVDEVPEFDEHDPSWTYKGLLKQTDYYSSKGNEDAYYYHEHEDPYPELWEHENGVCVLIPQRHKGKRSYAVAKEGIVG